MKSPNLKLNQALSVPTRVQFEPQRVDVDEHILGFSRIMPERGCVACWKLWLIDRRRMRKIPLEDVKSSPFHLVLPSQLLMSSASVFFVPPQVKTSG